MGPPFRILAGPDLDHLTPITSLVNTGKPLHLKSDLFEGDILVYLKDFGVNDDAGKRYFQSPERPSRITWSIQAQGRFLRPYTGDDVLFGNTFDDPLELPWGSGPVLKLMSHTDPTLKHNLKSDTKPWVLSPLISATPYLFASRGKASPPFPPDSLVLKEDATSLISENNGAKAYDTTTKRRTYFQDPENRRKVTLDKQVTLAIDFCHGHLSFDPKLALKIPGGIKMDLERLWDGRQVRFVCCERGKPLVEGGENVWGRMFWCVAFEPLEEGEKVGES